MGEKGMKEKDGENDFGHQVRSFAPAFESGPEVMRVSCGGRYFKRAV
jgi:hypothetical protein